jgi:uncharacterized membrane protein YphA (DoxX/SURF4 family)
MDYIQVASFGLGLHDAALAVIRIAVGVFFAISGYHKLFNKARHQRLLTTLINDHVPFARFNQWWVPLWEFTAGVMLALGLLTAFSAVVLLIVCLVACGCEAAEKVAKYQPIDFADKVDDYLYLPEVLYVVMLTVSALAGGGAYSLDALIWN